MKERSLTLLVACGAALAVATVLSNSTGFAQGRDVAGIGSKSIPLVGAFEPSLRSVTAQRVDDLRRQLKAANSPRLKEQARRLLREALVEYFDGDMKQRRAELDELTSRSSGMSAAVEKRAAAKEQLIDLQMKSFRYEAEGLGLFPSRPSGNGYGGEEGMFDNGSPFGAGGYGESFGQSSGTGGSGTMSMMGMGASSGGMGMGMGGMAAAEVDPVAAAMFQVNDAHRRFRTAKSEQDRTKATTVLNRALSAYFDRDMNARQQEIDAINAGLKKMLDGLKKRATAKDDIVDLQLQIIANEVEGLGFFRTSESSPGQPAAASSFGE